MAQAQLPKGGLVRDHDTWELRHLVSRFVYEISYNHIAETHLILTWVSFFLLSSHPKAFVPTSGSSLATFFRVGYLTSKKWTIKKSWSHKDRSGAFDRSFSKRPCIEEPGFWLRVQRNAHSRRSKSRFVNSHITSEQLCYHEIAVGLKQDRQTNSRLPNFQLSDVSPWSSTCQSVWSFMPSMEDHSMQVRWFLFPPRPRGRRSQQLGRNQKN